MHQDQARGQAVGGRRTATTNDKHPAALPLLSCPQTALRLVSINA
jgi:hypothetical protein